MDLQRRPRAWRILHLLALLTLLAPAARAQDPCRDFGSTPVAAAVVASPLALACPSAPQWPQWHLLTPGHRAPTPHVGFRPGDAHALPRLLVRYRCTGLLLVPVVPVDVRLSGYVLDQPEYACAVTS